jgi:hypothetical protein
MNNHGSYLASGANGEDGRRLFEVIVTKCKCDDHPGSACTQSVTVVYQGNTINMRWTKEKVCSFSLVYINLVLFLWFDLLDCYYDERCAG